MVYLGPVRSTDPDMPLGIAEARVPPVSSETVEETLEGAGFNRKSNAVIMADTANTDVALQIDREKGIVDRHLVNHREKHDSNAIGVFYNVETGETRPSKDGTQKIDSIWKHMDVEIPDSSHRPDADEQREMWTEYIRNAQWRCMSSTGDRWQAFCEVAQAWEDEQVESD